jgi:hypothetical protein
MVGAEVRLDKGQSSCRVESHEVHVSPPTWLCSSGGEGADGPPRWKLSKHRLLETEGSGMAA